MKVGSKVKVYKESPLFKNEFICEGLVTNLDITLGEQFNDLVEVEIRDSNKRILVRNFQCEEID